jgi:N-acetylglucosaminyldiphosphoundecaprenol N-acetyl-beta-D-mannosaminyltransferase
MQTFPRHETSPLKTKQFELWYQPVYDLPNGAVIHNEILLRWRASTGTLKSPRDFMPSIFEGGLEKWLDRFVLERAVGILDRNPGSKLSINLSREVLEDCQIAMFIYDLINETQIDPNRLHLELSEKNISKDIRNHISLIQDLKQIGCTVVLDNFANDYLTFMQWESLGVDFIKIRGDLIHRSEQDFTSEILLQSIFEVGRSIDQMVVAKSIEAINTSIFLDKLRTGPVQGNHIKPPSPELCLTGKVDILGVPIDNLSMDDLLHNLRKGTVFTPNVDHLMNARKHKDFGRAYSVADYKLCDSQILFFASRFLGSPIIEKISGSDLFPAFYEYHKENPDITIFLLGGLGLSSQQAQANINKKINRNIVIDAYSPPFGFDQDEEECLRIVQRINQSGATVLAIGVGAPKQEKWISQYRQYLTSVNIIFAIGATIDFEAGLVPRAPRVVSLMGVEWLYRLMMEPKRLWKRYLINDLPFIWLLLKQKILS